MAVKPLQKLFEIFWSNWSGSATVKFAPFNVEEKSFLDDAVRIHSSTLKGAFLANLNFKQLLKGVVRLLERLWPFDGQAVVTLAVSWRLRLKTIAIDQPGQVDHFTALRFKAQSRTQV